MRKNLNVIFLLLFSTLYLPLFSQQPVIYNFNINNGLNAHIINMVACDNNGFLWIATDYGVVRFDGENFRHYTSIFSDKIIQKIFKTDNKLWFCTNKGLLYELNQGKIKAFDFNFQLTKYLNNSPPECFFRDKKNNYWLVNNNGKVIKISTDAKIQYMDVAQEQPEGYQLFLKRLNNGLICQKIHTQPNNSFSCKAKLTPKAQGNFLMHCDSGNENLSYHYILLNKSELFLASFHHFFHIKNHKIINHFCLQDKISGIFYDNKGNTWISVKNKGVYFYAQSDFDLPPQLFLKGISPGKVTQDIEENYWIPTKKQGLFYIPDINFRQCIPHQSISDYPIKKAEIINDYLLFTSTNDQRYYASLNQSGDIISNFKKLVNNSLPQNSNTYKIPNQLARKTIDTVLRKKNEWIGITKKRVFIKNKKGIKWLKPKESLQFNCIEKCARNKIWLGTNKGLYELKNEKLLFNNEHPLFSTHIAHISHFNGFLIVASHKQGVLLKKNNIIYHLNTSNVLLSNTIINIETQGDSMLWVAGDNGLTRLNFYPQPNELPNAFSIFPDLSKEDYSINILSNIKRSLENRIKLTSDFIDHKKGLAQSPVLSFAKKGNRIWVITQQKIVCFKLDNINFKKNKPHLYFSSIKINGQDTSLLKNYTLYPGKRNIEIDFNAVSFKNRNHLEFLYQFPDKNSKWVEVKNHFLRFSSLAPGQYQLRLKVRHKNKPQLADIHTIKFDVRKKFTETIYFYLLISFFIVGLILGLSYYFYVQQLKRNQLKQQLMLSEQKALRTQMNPHFLFNSLGAIQGYLTEDAEPEADILIQKFARLMRKILDNSRHFVIPFKTEIETIQLYLDIEQFRFDNTFQYKINYPEKTDIQKIVIPPMIIQPFLENAILHGLATKKGQRKLEINFEIIKQNLFIIIIDNGIGRKAAKKINKKRTQYTAVGTSNVQERIKLINQIIKSKIKFHTIDLYDNQQKASGTKIKITIPFKDLNKNKTYR